MTIKFCERNGNTMSVVLWLSVFCHSDFAQALFLNTRYLTDTNNCSIIELMQLHVLQCVFYVRMDATKHWGK